MAPEFRGILLIDLFSGFGIIIKYKDIEELRAKMGSSKQNRFSKRAAKGAKRQKRMPNSSRSRWGEASQPQPGGPVTVM